MFDALRKEGFTVNIKTSESDGLPLKPAVPEKKEKPMPIGVRVLGRTTSPVGYFPDIYLIDGTKQTDIDGLFKHIAKVRAAGGKPVVTVDADSKAHEKWAEQRGRLERYMKGGIDETTGRSIDGEFKMKAAPAPAKKPAERSAEETALDKMSLEQVRQEYKTVRDEMYELLTKSPRTDADTEATERLQRRLNVLKKVLDERLRTMEADKEADRGR
jgi:hypothetical protein